MGKEEEMPHNQQYDLVITGKSLVASLMALRAVRKGLQVVVYAEEPVRGEKGLDSTHIFPFNISCLLKSKQEYRMVRYLQRMSPHLVIPQRNVAFFKKPPYPASVLSWIDRIMGNSGENKSLLIQTAKNSELSLISHNNYPWTLTIREYKVNSERLTIEILKRFKSLGGLIRLGKIRDLKQDSRSIEFCEDQSGVSVFTRALIDITRDGKGSMRYELGELSIPFDNRIVLKNEDIDLVIDSRDSKSYMTIFKGTYESANLAVNELFGEKILINQSDDKVEKETEVSRISSEKLLVINESGPQNMEKSAEFIIRFVKSALNVSLREEQEEPLAGSDYPFRGDYRILAELCDEKFDIAKQTGVQFNTFKKLFYRYGTQIDQMTDRAYELLEESRDVDKIWAKVEEEFLKQEDLRLIV